MWNKIIDISSKATKQWKSILLIYGVQLVLGSIVAVIAYRQFNGAIGSSLELDRLANGFDRSIFSDMINKFPVIIEHIQSRFALMVVLFLMLSIFLHAGLLSNIRYGYYSIFKYFQNANIYFFKFLKVVLISLILKIVVLAIIWVPFFMLIGDPLETFHSEKTLIFTVIGLVILSALCLIVIWLWSVLSRYHIVDENRLLVSMKSGWRLLISNFARYYIVGCGLILLHVIITWLYTLVVDDWGAETWFTVLALVIMQQLFSLIRIWIRVFGYSAVND
ncbi:hypothetical protein N9602_03235 [Saprospiraceae bacterium]|nr:hypothetical protein [Saprospiraceae bacterium]MDB4162871.1 hypothetical protein [Saprospiraceae bacterium]MDB9914682.1 hypothetical protein [Saprospiraceae bacterium]MDC1308523.1 hypothetical protein [Saprospiraceae bacterium]HCV50842.1 hypothetical protein [Saprospirales bacterium]